MEKDLDLVPDWTQKQVVSIQGRWTLSLVHVNDRKIFSGGRGMHIYLKIPPQPQGFFVCLFGGSFSLD